MEMGEDIELLVKLREAGLRISATEEVLLTRRFFGDNLTYSLGLYDSTFRDAIRRHVARRRTSA
jgi:hypothetical protein